MPGIVSTGDSSTFSLSMRPDYFKASSGQKKVFDLAVRYIDEGIAAHSGRLPSAFPLCVADFGSNGGPNSSAAMSAIIGGFRKKYGFDGTKSILAVHNDLPMNNWAALFNYLHAEGSSYLTAFEGVHSLASGNSFYQQILPDNSLHFGFSCVSLHWMSNMPCKISNHCLPSKGSADEAEMCKKQAAEDWERFLAARSKELVQGGILTLHVLSADDAAFAVMIDTCYAAAQKLCEENCLTQQEVADFNLRIWTRNLDEVTDADQLRRLGYELVLGEVCKAEAREFLNLHLLQSNADIWAQAASSAIVVALEPSFMAALSSDRSPEDKKSICEKLKRGMVDQLKTVSESKFGDFTANIFVVLRKK